MALSTQRAVSDGTLALLSLSIDYFDRSDITVLFNSVQRPVGNGWNWVGTTDKKISFSPVVPAGTEIAIKRSTPMDLPRHEYTQGAQFVAETLDENFKQMLRIVQETKEGGALAEVFNDLDMHGFRLRNIGTAQNDDEAVSLAQYKADAAGANQAKLAAQASQADALASKNAAKTSEDNALASKNAAATSASNASTSEGNALSSKNAAAQSATNAATSEGNALASKNAAATSLTNFQNQYQGPLASAPATRKDSSALQIGDLYFDTATGMRVYTAQGWASAGSSVNGTAKRGSIVATEGQTAFTVVGGFDPGFIDVYLDGAKLVNAVDVTVNSSPVLTLAVGARAGQTVDYVAYGTFNVANTYDQATIDAKLTAATGLQQYRNRLINGAMMISQRQNPSVGATGTGQYGPDRWLVTYNSNGGVPVISQETANSLPGYRAYLQAYQNTAAATSVTEFMARQQIEMCNIRDLIGKNLMLSFWYKSNKTGQHAARVIGNIATGSAGGTDQILPFTVNAANTWEFKTLSFNAIAGLTSWGTNALTGLGIIVDIGLKSNTTGQSSLAVSDYFQLVGVQLEAGTTATDFEFRPYPVEMTMCQRYYENLGTGLTGPYAPAGQTSYMTWFFKTVKRITPAWEPISGGGSNVAVYASSANIMTFKLDNGGYAYATGAVNAEL